MTALRELSLGAGVQSTTIALMVAEGRLDQLDGAIFADTGWEPRQVYEHLNRLEEALSGAGVPLYRVARGNLRDDVLSPYAQAGIPYYTRGPLTRVVVIDEEQACPLFCGWHEYNAAREEISLEYEDEGGYLEEDDEEELEKRLAALTPPEVNCTGCDNRGQIVTKSHTEWRRNDGMGARRCTGRYKVEPIEKQIRILLGATVRTKPCRYCDATGRRVPPWQPSAGFGPCSVCRGSGNRTLVGSVPPGGRCEQWIGFSTDEVHRVSNGRFPSYVTPRYPLLELDMSRQDCIGWLAERGWLNVAKSACVGCPLHGNRQWRNLRDHHPGEWADAVEFDRDFRRGDGMLGERYLHESRLPLDQAPIARLTRAERESLQPSLLDLLEEGDPDGCSPYGCRSGTAVEIGGETP